MRASVVRPRELGELELRRWAEFQAADLELQNPFLSAGFARAVDSVSDRVRVAVFEEGTTVVGFLAFELRSRGVATAVGGKVNNRQAFVHAPGLAWTWAGLLAAAKLDVLELGDLVGKQSDGRRSLESVAAPVIDTTMGWDAYLASVKKSKNVKTTLYKERKLRRELPDVRFESGPAKDCAQLRRLVAWKSQQYRRSGWPDLFARRGVVDLLDVLSADSEPGLHPVASSLHVDGQLVATDLSLASDTVFAGWFAAHDPEWSKFSPGAIRTLRTVEAAFDLGVMWVDLSRGDEGYKDTLKTSDCEVATGYLSRPSTRSVLYEATHIPAARIRSYVLTHPEIRSFVRESLRRVGSAREAISRRGT